MEGIIPFREVQIADEDRWPPLMSVRDDIVEVLALFGVHGLEAEVVTDSRSTWVSAASLQFCLFKARVEAICPGSLDERSARYGSCGV